MVAQEFWSVTNKYPLFVAIYTQPRGKKTTTIKNALSDLYNITTAENDLITSKFEFNVPINMLDHSCFVYWNSGLQQKSATMDLVPIQKKIDDLNSAIGNQQASINSIFKNLKFCQFH